MTNLYLAFISVMLVWIYFELKNINKRKDK